MKAELIATAGLYAAASARPQQLSKRSGVQYFGINIAGFDFGCGTDGSDDWQTSATPPLSSLGGPDGAGQMSHFAKDDGMNIFRLPVGWQYLVANNLGGDLDPTNSGNYDQLVQACLSTGATCLIDVHNYARWDGGIIGQGGPTNDQFASLWTNIATKYAGQDNLFFGLMNEPHDLDISTWAGSVQAAVTAIRNAESSSGGIQHTILIPGTEYTSAGAFPSMSGPSLVGITNPDGSTTDLVFDVHQYSDSDYSGTHTECVTNNIDGAFSPLATYLRSVGRQALLSEMGGGNTASCETDICQQVQYLNDNSDVFLGFIGWAAGSFDPSTYALSEVPTDHGGTWTDVPLVSMCFNQNT
ncbi:glycoside hydrolase family 5 protein [Xylariaceae sp. FL0255]|nr:glycoside hydrolase family 5 protein [Xylariaceae sp. FL0255]